MLSKESEPKSSGLRSSAGLAGSAVGVFKLEISNSKLWTSMLGSG